MAGPVDIAVISFPGNKFNGDIAPALKALVDAGTVNVLDLVFVHKDASGNITHFELGDAEAQEVLGFGEIDGDLDDLLSEEDILTAAGWLDDNSSAALIVWENVWADRFASAIRDSNGELVAYERIPASALQATMEYHSQAEKDK